MDASSSTARSPLHILGVKLHRLTPPEVLQILDRWAQEGKRRHVVTVNPEFLVQARERPDFLEALQRADMALADGAGIVLASRLLGRPVPARIPGVDLVEHIAGLAARNGYRVFFLGAAPGTAEAAAAVLEARYAGLEVAGCYAGSPGPEDEEEILSRVRAAQPHFLLVAYGAPEQDLWIRRNLDLLGVQVAMGIGGSFDFISGRVPRAPAWMRRLGLEWLFRLVREPWRWRRMLRLPRFALLVVLQWLGMLRGLEGEA